MNRYLDQVTETELLSVPGLQPLRQELLSAALTFYSELTEERSDDPTLQVELASAHYRLGRIHAELGDGEKSRPANAEAVRLFEQLRERDPNNLDVQVGLAEAYYHANRYDDVVELSNTILQTEPRHAEIRSLLATTYNALALAETNDNDLASALEHHQKAFELREVLARDFPTEARHLGELASTLNNIGVLLARQKNHGEALAMYERAVTYDVQAWELQPQSILWGRWLCIGLRNVAATRKELGRAEQALEAYQEHVSVNRRLVFRNPAVASLRVDLYRAYLDLARHQEHMGLKAESIVTFRRARDVLENLPRETPQEQLELARVYGVLARPPDEATASDEAATPDEADEQDNNDAAREHYAALAVGTLRQAVEAGYADAGTLKTSEEFEALRDREDFQAILNALEKAAEAEKLAEAKAGSDEQKIAEQRKAADLLRELVDELPAGVRHRTTLAATLHSIGVIQTALKQFDEAEKSLEEALQRRDQLRAELEDRQATLDVFATRMAIGQLHWERGDFAQAHRAWQACTAEMEQLSESSDDPNTLIADLLDIQRHAYVHYASLGLLPLAGEFLSRQADAESVGSARGSGLASDGELSTVLLLGDRDLARRYLQQLAASLGEGERPWSDVMHLARGIGALGDSSLLSDDLLARTRDLVDQTPAPRGIAVALAALEFRAKQFNEAQATLAPFASSEPQVDFLGAAIAWKLGDEDRARQLWTEGESRHAEICRQALTRNWADSRRGVFDPYWWSFAESQAMRRMAFEVMTGEQSPPEDPWRRLIQARGFWLLGEHEKSHAELAVAVAAAPNDPEFWAAQARMFQEWGDADAAEAAWHEITERAGDDPMPWIRRGRWYAERGEHAKADADFAQAASLTPHELNRFLEAGWWVVGPYPHDLDQPCPPEENPDPSRPVPLLDSQQVASEQPAGWRTIPTEGPDLLAHRGHPSLDNNHKQVSLYALAYVYSPDQREETLVVGGNHHVRVWLNGQLAHETTRVRDSTWVLDRVVVTLQPGRNTLLVKINNDQGPYYFRVRLRDNPLDRSLAAAELGLWDEAAAAFALVADRLHDRDLHRFYASWLMAAGDVDAYRRQCERLRNRESPAIGASNPHGAWSLAAACSYGPQGIDDPERLVELADIWMNAGLKEPERMVWTALTHYRAGQFERTVQLLENASLRRHSMAWPLLAMAHHHLGHSQDAEQWLAKSADWRNESLRKLTAAPPIRLPLTFWERENYVAFQVLYDEAAELIHGKALAEEPLLHLLRAHAYMQQKVWDRAEAELAAAIAAAPSDPDLWVTQARLFEEWRNPDRSAQSAWQKVVELAGDDPLPWIRRGRWYAERGEHAKADADFARAASLTPHELNKFLEAGWWIAGPYPADLQQACPPEDSPDPSRPVQLVDPASGEKVGAADWRYVPSGNMGMVDCRTLFPTGDASCYALTYVYSPDERTAMLLVGGYGELRVWVNGRLEHEAAPASHVHWLPQQAPVTLRPGRNTILVKATPEGIRHKFAIRLGDAPLERAFALADMGLWDEAAQTLPLDEVNALGFAWLSNRCAALLLAADDQERYRRQRAWMLEQFGDASGTFECWNAAYACVLSPLSAEDAQRVLDLAERGQSGERYRVFVLALACYRAGRFDETISRLAGVTDFRLPLCDLVRAMAHFQRGELDRAQNYLAAAERAYDAMSKRALAGPLLAYPRWWWPDRAEFDILHREARALIAPAAGGDDLPQTALQARARQQLAQRDSLTAAFDHALTVNPDRPQLWLARGRRLAELGRWEEATADLEQAVELRPDDDGVRAQRDAILAEFGRTGSGEEVTPSDPQDERESD